MSEINDEIDSTMDRASKLLALSVHVDDMLELPEGTIQIEALITDGTATEADVLDAAHQKMHDRIEGTNNLVEACEVMLEMHGLIEGRIKSNPKEELNTLRAFAHEIQLTLRAARLGLPAGQLAVLRLVLSDDKVEEILTEREEQH